MILHRNPRATQLKSVSKCSISPYSCFLLSSWQGIATISLSERLLLAMGGKRTQAVRIHPRQVTPTKGTIIHGKEALGNLELKLCCSRHSISRVLHVTL